jgi:Ca2+/H+ antiporter
MEEIRRIAYETVLRACGFASLAIFCVMFGLSFQPRSAFQAGGFLTIAMTCVLVLKAYEARTKNHRRTELWLNLPKERRPPEASAQRTIATVMRETYLQFARWTAVISIVLWTIALFFSAIGL